MWLARRRDRDPLARLTWLILTLTLALALTLALSEGL